MTNSDSPITHFLLGFFLIEFLGVTLDNKITQVSGAEFHSTSSVPHTVCSPPQSGLLPSPFAPVSCLFYKRIISTTYGLTLSRTELWQPVQNARRSLHYYYNYFLELHNFNEIQYSGSINHH